MAESEANRKVDLPRIERAIREILIAVGEDPERDGLRETPSRVARMYAELFGGLHERPEEHLEAMFDEDHHEMVVLRDIPFNSMCEHHLMPFEGQVHIAYIPGGKVLGLSKLARIVDVCAPSAGAGTPDLADRGPARPTGARQGLRRHHGSRPHLRDLPGGQEVRQRHGDLGVARPAAHQPGHPGRSPGPAAQALMVC